MADMRILSEVPPLFERNGEPDYRRCDCCSECFYHDIWAGLHNEPEWRRFYELLGEGLIVCEHCLPDLGSIQEVSQCT